MSDDRKDWVIPWLGILIVLIIIFFGSSLWWLFQDVHVEGEIIGKEDRQSGFLSSSPPMLAINQSDGSTVMVRVSLSDFHKYEEGDWFNETMSNGDVGIGINIGEMLVFFIMIMPIIVFIGLMNYGLRRRFL